MMECKWLIILSAALILGGCTDSIVIPSESNLNRDDFEAAWKRVNDVYPYLDQKGIDWDSLYNVYEPRAEQSMGDEIFEVLIDMLAELKDMHIHVKTAGGRLIQTYQSPRWLKDKDAFQPVVVRNYFDKELRITGEGNIEYGILPGDIGYIYIGSFNVAYMKDPFYEALDFVRNRDALIIDIRHNNGGSFENVELVVERFITSPLERPEYYQLGKLVRRAPLEPDGDFQYVKPVVVLINGVCVSSGDYFPELMKQIPTVTVVGDTTAGASAGSSAEAPARYELPSGKIILVGTSDFRRYDGIPWEWIGIPPDILVGQTKGDLENGRDRQLESAIGMLSKMNSPLPYAHDGGIRLKSTQITETMVTLMQPREMSPATVYLRPKR